MRLALKYIYLHVHPISRNLSLGSHHLKPSISTDRDYTISLHYHNYYPFAERNIPNHAIKMKLATVLLAAVLAPLALATPMPENPLERKASP